MAFSLLAFELVRLIANVTYHKGNSFSSSFIDRLVPISHSGPPKKGDVGPARLLRQLSVSHVEREPTVCFLVWSLWKFSM